MSRIAGSWRELAPLRRNAATAIACTVYGSGPPLLFIHGLGLDYRVWHPVVEVFQDAYSCVLVDLPGHGSSAARSRFDYPGIADALHQTLSAAGFANAFVVGHSLGGVVATYYAARHPTRAIINVDQRLELGPFVAALGQFESQLRGPGFATVLEGLLSTFGLDRLPPDLRDLVLACWQPRQATVLGYWDILFRHSVAELDAILSAELRAIDAPYLALHGNTPDVEYNAWLAARVGRCRIVDYDDGGHFIQLENVARFVTFVREFFAAR